MTAMMTTVNIPITFSSVEIYLSCSIGALLMVDCEGLRDDPAVAMTGAATGCEEAGRGVNFLCLDFAICCPFYFALGCAFS